MSTKGESALGKYSTAHNRLTMIEKSKLQPHFMISECRYISAAFTPNSRVLPMATSSSFSLR